MSQTSDYVTDTRPLQYSSPRPLQFFPDPFSFSPTPSVLPRTLQFFPEPFSSSPEPFSSSPEPFSPCPEGSGRPPEGSGGLRRGPAEKVGKTGFSKNARNRCPGPLGASGASGGLWGASGGPSGGPWGPLGAPGALWGPGPCALRCGGARSAIYACLIPPLGTGPCGTLLRAPFVSP